MVRPWWFRPTAACRWDALTGDRGRQALAIPGREALPPGAGIGATDAGCGGIPLCRSSRARGARPQYSLDEESAVRVIIEASDHRLYMTAAFVKASGLGVCAAPPVSNRQAATQVIGQMQLTDLTDDIAAATQLRRRAELDIKHPQNTGLRMNQVTMMFIPLRFISRIEVQQGDGVIWTMDGGMTLSENPRIAFDYQVNGAGRLRVRAEDRRHGVWEQSFPIGSSS